MAINTKKSILDHVLLCLFMLAILCFGGSGGSVKADHHTDEIPPASDVS